MPVDTELQRADTGNKHSIACGIIMPISATAEHEKAHWDAMLQLLFRAIEAAGCVGKPVWIDSSTDRVSERIIGNIFEHTVVVADITDLNPNVMFELGLRLASKKPTLVVMEEGGSIPFDIRDFHIHIYPKHLSILGMEKFLDKVSNDIRAKIEAFDRQEYTPFLSKVVVDVVSPDEREVSMNQFLLDQLRELNRKVASIDNLPRNTSPDTGESAEDLIVSTVGSKGAVFFIQLNISQANDFIEEIKPAVDEVIEIDRERNKIYIAAVKRGVVSGAKLEQIRDSVREITEKYKGLDHVPRRISDKYSL